jgi:hypothetical protein
MHRYSALYKWVNLTLFFFKSDMYLGMVGNVTLLKNSVFHSITKVDWGMHAKNQLSIPG